MNDSLLFWFLLLIFGGGCFIVHHFFPIQAERERFQAKEQARRDRELEKRKKEREKEREQRDKERQAIRDKYQLPAKGSGAGSTSSATRHQAPPEDKDKCVISWSLAKMKRLLLLPDYRWSIFTYSYMYMREN